MKSQRLAIALMVINVVTLAFLVVCLRPATADGGAKVLRVRALEVVDDHGRVRAQILVMPESTMPDGKKSPTSTLLRLIDENGRPDVKLGGSGEGSGMSLAGDSERREWSGIQILAKSAESSLILTNKDGRKQVIKP